MLKKLIILTSYSFLSLSSAWAQFTLKDVEKLRNDKEVISRTLNKKDLKVVREVFEDPEVNKRINQTFSVAILEYLNIEESRCEFHFLDIVKDNFLKAGLSIDEDNLALSFKYLRSVNAIDDILLDILLGVNKDAHALGLVNKKKGKLKFDIPRKKLDAKNDLAALFSGFATWPDERSSCSYQGYVVLKANIKNKEGKPSDSKKKLGHLIRRAYKKKIITAETFNRLEYLRTESNVNNRRFWLNDYFKTIFNAKNKMRPIKSTYQVLDISKEDDFSTERIRRFSRLTRRDVLYRKYNETQIILLAQVLQKASRRMGVDPDTETKRPVITQEFSVLNEDGERENYVDRIELDPQSQFNLARRLLRKDMVELQMMDSFVGMKITHEDIVMAAFETGYISFEDLEHVVKYDDLWNPHKSDLEKIVGFVSTVCGIGSIFLPPPWNVTAAIAIGVIEGIIMNKHRNGADNDNPATFIE